jgi:hypothetical protein
MTFKNIALMYALLLATSRIQENATVLGTFKEEPKE